MTSKELSNGILRTIFILVAIGLLLYFIVQIQAVLVYLIVSLLLTMLGNPIAKFLEIRLKFKPILAVITVLTFYILLISGFIWLFVPLISSQSEQLALLDSQAIEQNYQLIVNQIETYLSTHNIDTSEFFKRTSVAPYLSSIPDFVNGFIGTLGSFGVGIASVLFITFFFMKDKIIFYRNFLRIIPIKYEVEILNSLDRIQQMLARYFSGLLLQLFIVFMLYLIVLLIVGVENALIIALICGVLNIIPYIGPLFALILAAILTITSNINLDFSSEVLPKTIYVIIGFFIVQLIDNNFSQPYIFSKSTQSHPLEIFLVTLIAGILFGIVGMIVAVPFYTALKVILHEFFPNHKISKVLTKKMIE